MAWISVKKRLPKKNGMYIVYNNWQNNVTLNYNFANFKNGSWDFSVFCELDNITHWQPLPKPPKNKLSKLVAPCGDIKNCSDCINIKDCNPKKQPAL